VNAEPLNLCSINRGRRSEGGFSRKEDYNVFMDLLKELVDKVDVRIGERGDLNLI